MTMGERIKQLRSANGFTTVSRYGVFAKTFIITSSC